MNQHVVKRTPASQDPLSPADRAEIERLVIEDNEPVDSNFAEKLQRLLTTILYLCWAGPGKGRVFAAFANVGLFRARKVPPKVPDVMVSLDVPPDRDLSRKENNTYIQWVIGKPPEVVIEIVSDRRGGERTSKMRYYATAGVRYYVIFDPQHYLSEQELEVFELQAGAKYQLLERPWLAELGLGLVVREGRFENARGRWLRWCDADGKPLPTPEEKLAEDRERLAAERRRVRASRRRIRTEKQRADEEKQRADEEKQRADEEKQRASRLAEKLRSLGIDPDA